MPTQTHSSTGGVTAKQRPPGKPAKAPKKPAKAPKKPAKAPKKPAKAPKAVTSKSPKTTPNNTPLQTLLAELDAATRADCERLDAWMKAATGAAGVMYGKAIVGYGSSTIRYADGREAPWLKLGFSPRKQSLVLYGVLAGASAALLDQLGKHDTGKGCLYVKRLSDVDGQVLQRIIRAAARA